MKEEIVYSIARVCVKIYVYAKCKEVYAVKFKIPVPPFKLKTYDYMQGGQLGVSLHKV